MATTLQDIIVPELFNPYVINRSMELSALYQSGIVSNNAEFDRLASEPAPIHHISETSVQKEPDRRYAR